MVCGPVNRFHSILISILVGTTLAFSFQSGNWLLAIFSLAGFFYLLSTSNARTKLISTTIVLSVWFGIHVYWMVAIGLDAWILLVIVCMLPWFLTVLYPIPSNGWGTFLVPMGLIFAIEWLRSNFPWGGFPWGILAFSQVDGPLVWLGRIGGQELVSGAVVLCSVSIWQICSRGEIRKALVCLGAVAVLATVGASTKNEPSGSTRIAVVQGSVPTDSSDLGAQQRRVFGNHIDMTNKLAADVTKGLTKKPELVIWPENATDLDPINNLAVRDEIQKVVDKLQTPLLVGGVTWQSNPYGPRNAGILWLPKSGPLRMYAKKHLVPFGEYVPMRELVMSRIGRLSQIPNDFVQGESSGVLSVNDYKFGDVICFEVAYQDHLRTLVTEGANFFTVQTNNATYINRGQAQQQFAIARFRAIEHTRSTAVASTTGISGLIDSNGRIQAVTKEGEAKYLIGNFDLHNHLNFTDRYPYALPSLYLVASLGLAMAGVIAKMRVRYRANRASQ